MSLRYYPLTRIIPNKYTRGNEFLLPDGTPYTGRYYTTFDGKSYTGINPVLGTNELLTPVDSVSANEASLLIPGRPSVVNRDNNVVRPYANARVQNSQAVESVRLTELVPYFPIPLESDYARGYFTRYFAKTVSGPGYVFEISELDWTKIQNGDVDDTVLGYETIDMLWQLTGPLNNKRISQYQIQGGVFDTNKRVTEAKAKVFTGLLAFIGGDYTKFARITP